MDAVNEEEDEVDEDEEDEDEASVAESEEDAADGEDEDEVSEAEDDVELEEAVGLFHTACIKAELKTSSDEIGPGGPNAFGLPVTTDRTTLNKKIIQRPSVFAAVDRITDRMQAKRLENQTSDYSK